MPHACEERFSCQTSHGCEPSSGGGLICSEVPGGGLVIAAVVAQAAVQDADEPVGQGSQGLVVGGAAGALSVVVVTGAGRDAQCGEGLVVEGVGEASVAGVAGQHDPPGSGGAGDRGHAGVVLAGLGVGVG